VDSLPNPKLVVVTLNMLVLPWEIYIHRFGNASLLPNICMLVLSNILLTRGVIHDSISYMGRDRVNRVFELIGAQIAGLRRARHMSQADLASYCGLQRPSVVLIEQGRQFIPIDGLYKIAKALACDIGELLPSVKMVFEGGISTSVGDYPLDASSKSLQMNITEREQVEAILRKVDVNHETTSRSKS
jgi:transcriptional regulator with XRE-family HTH domain